MSKMEYDPFGEAEYVQKIGDKQKKEIIYIKRMHTAQRNSYSTLSGEIRLLSSFLKENVWAGRKRVYVANFDITKMEYRNDQWEFDTDLLTVDKFRKNSRMTLFGKPELSPEGFHKNLLQLKELTERVETMSGKVDTTGILKKEKINLLQQEIERLGVEVRWTIEKTSQNILAIAEDEQFHEVRDSEIDVETYIDHYLKAQSFLRAKRNVRVLNTEAAPLCNALISYSQDKQFEEIKWKDSAHYFRVRAELLAESLPSADITELYCELLKQSSILAQEVLGRDAQFLKEFIGEVDMYEKMPHYIEEVYMYCIYGRYRMPKNPEKQY